MSRTRSKCSFHIKPTKRCNLCCCYCFERYPHPSSSSSSELNTEDIALILKKIRTFVLKHKIKEIELNYSGGEVFIKGIDFWETVLNQQKQFFADSAVRVITNFQTNLTLLDENFLSLIKKNNITVGTSLDPFARTRPFLSNREDSAATVIDKLIILAKNNVHAGLIVAICKESMGRTKEILNLLNKINASYHIQAMYPMSYKYTSDLALTAEEFAGILIQILDQYFSSQNKKGALPPGVEPLFSYIKNAKYGKLVYPVSGCNFAEVCLANRIFIENDGIVYPCDLLRGRDFVLGNIFIDSISTLFKKLNELVINKVLVRASFLRERCKGCEFEKMCNGGCMGYTVWKNGFPVDLEFNCKVNKIIYSYLFRKKIKNWPSAKQGNIG